MSVRTFPPGSAAHPIIRYTERLAEADAVPSVGSGGDSYDNVPAETIIDLFKTEVIRKRVHWEDLGEMFYRKRATAEEAGHFGA